MTFFNVVCMFLPLSPFKSSQDPSVLFSPLLLLTGEPNLDHSARQRLALALVSSNSKVTKLKILELSSHQHVDGEQGEDL